MQRREPQTRVRRGVNAARFEFTAERRAWAEAERALLGFTADDFVIGFVGRLTRDKGIAELIRAFDRVLAEVPHARLLVVGELDSRTRASLEANPRVTRADRLIEERERAIAEKAG